jgi:hypothetical protein
MLKPKTTRPNNLGLWIAVGVLILAGIITLIISFNSANAQEDEVNAAYTNAAETVTAQQLTMLAASPTATPTVITLTPSLTFTPFVTSTLFQSTLAAPTTSSGTGGSTAVGCDNSAFVADVTIPDNTAMTAGQTFKKTWKLQNTGTCPWTTSYTITFLSGNKMNGVAEPITVEVGAGSSADVSVNMTAPATAGDAIGYWILANASGQQFGTNFYVMIKVGGSAVIAPTNTTGAPASTQTPSNTPEPAATQ